MNPIFSKPFDRRSPIIDSDITVSFEENAEKLDDCLKRNDTEKIIKDKILFWLAYCKALSTNQDKEKDIDFNVSIIKNKIAYNGKEIAIKETKNLIEEIRFFFTEGLETKKKIKLLLMGNIVGYFYHKKELSIGRCYSAKKYSKSWYHRFIQPALPKLTEFCGALYKEKTKNKIVDASSIECLSIRKIKSIEINWLGEALITYPIEPKTISEHLEIQKKFYSLYESQQLCDFTILAKDKAIQVHSCLLYANGGPVMQKLLTAEMEEASKKTISFSEYAATTIEAFLYFVYLGGKEFMIRFTSTKNNIKLNLFELFEFANIYQIEGLIDCCTNLMSLFASSKDLDLLKDLAHLYQNEHLSKLCEHLESIDIIKSIDIDL